MLEEESKRGSVARELDAKKNKSELIAIIEEDFRLREKKLTIDLTAFKEEQLSEFVELHIKRKHKVPIIALRENTEPPFLY